MTAITTVAVGIAFGQERGSGNLKGIRTPTESTLQVVLPQNAIDWHVAARLGSEEKAFLFAIATKMEDRACQSCATQATLPLNDLSSSVMVRGGLIDISHFDPNQRIGLLITVRPGQNVTVKHRDQELQLRPSVARQWTEVSAEGLVPGAGSIGDFFAAISTPVPRNGVQSFDKDGLAYQNGRYFTTPPRMKSRLVKYEVPNLPPPAEETRVQLIIEIDSRGNAKSMSEAHPATVYHAAAERAVSAWQFRPVIRENQAVAVRMPVVFVFSPDGKSRVVGF